MTLSPGGAVEYRPDIDGLRAVSIVAVVLYHARIPGFEAGYLGVDVFFVISGFLITGQLLRELKTTGSIRMSAFYARRVRRLLPAFAVMAVGTSVMAVLYLLPMKEQELFGNALARSAAFYYNIAVWRGGYAYGGEAAEQQLLMHTWSLGVEEQFYLVWPWICLAVVRLARPLAGFLALVLGSVFATWWVMPVDPNAAFFLLPFRAWELGVGACIAACPWSTSRLRSGAAAFFGAGLVGVALLSGKPPSPSMVPLAVVVLGTGLLTACGTAPNPASSFLRTKAMVFLGRMSYAWYLWHWPLLVIHRLVVSPEDPGLPVGALAGGFLLAAATYLWIERAAQRVKIERPARIIGGGAITLAAIVLLGLAIELRSKRWMAQPQNAALRDRLLRGLPDSCETSVASLGCELSVKLDQGPPSLFLWGDSFARALSPALSEYSRQSDSSVRLLFGSGCPPLLGVVPASQANPSKPRLSCQDLLRSVQENLRRDRSLISGVVLAGRWPAYAGFDVRDVDLRMFDWNGKEIEGSQALVGGLASTIDFLESLGLKALVVGVPPEVPFEAPKCLWRAPGRCSIDRSWNAHTRQQTNNAIAAVLRGRTGIRYVDLFDPLCPRPKCTAGSLDEPLLADRSHLSAFAATQLVLPILAPHLDWLRGVGSEDK